MTTVTTTATYKTQITADLPDWPLSDVTFRLVADFFTGDGEEILAGKEYKITLSATGNDDGAFYLPTPDNSGTTAVNWRLTLPSGYEEIVAVGYSATAQSVHDLIAAGSTTTDPDTIVAALASKAAKVSGATADNLASLTSGGDLADSGVAKTAVGNATKLQGRTLVDTAPADGQAVVWDAGNSQWEPGDTASDVGDLTTAGLTAANMLRVAAAGGLEERTPAQVAAAVQSSLSIGTTQLVHNNSLLTSLAYCFPLAESDGIRYDKVGAYALTDNNTVVQAGGVQGQAALFTAANTEFLSVASATQYQITGNTSFTFWLYPTSVSGSQGVFSKYGGTANEFVCQLASGQVRFTTYGGAADKTHSKVLAINTWYMVHIYIEGGALGISINNGAAETAAITGTIAASNSTFEIGAFTGAARYLNGRICNFMKHDKRLSALELTNLYNGGNGLLYPFS